MLGNNFKFLVLIASASILLTAGAQSAHAGFFSDITAGHDDSGPQDTTQFFVFEGDFFVGKNVEDIGDGFFTADPYVVDFDSTAGPWIKDFTLCVDNGGSCDDHTVEAGEDITITEFIEVIGDTDFTDWHE